MSRLTRTSYEEMDEREDRWQDDEQDRRDRLAVQDEPEMRCVECGTPLDDDAPERCMHCGRHT